MIDPVILEPEPARNHGFLTGLMSCMCTVARWELQMSEWFWCVMYLCVYH